MFDYSIVCELYVNLISTFAQELRINVVLTETLMMSKITRPLIFTSFFMRQFNSKTKSISLIWLTLMNCYLWII